MLFNLSDAWAQPGRILSGEVRSAVDGQPLQGVTITDEKGKGRALTDEEGRFAVRVVAEQGRLLVSYIGHQSRTIAYNQDTTLLQIQLEPGNNEIDEIEVVSTGYQMIPKERATGSFVQIDSAIINRSNNSNLLQRLDGVTSGLVFNRNKTQNSQSDLMIRGRSTLFGEDKPLIVVDNFPYEDDINSLNPNDIASITLLRDAAAAAIWGTRAGNGVLVITTKQGRSNIPTKVSLNGNITIGQRPDLFKAEWFNAADWLEIEQFLFNNGAYRIPINNGYGMISPGVEIMQETLLGNLSSTDSLNAMESLKQMDVRTDMEKFLYRPDISQQYNVSLSGGGAHNTYFTSLGYDKRLANSVTDDNERVSMLFNNRFNWLDNRLQLETGLQFSNMTDRSGTTRFTPYSPYQMLRSDDGRNLAVDDGTLRLSYAKNAGDGQLLDWQFVPLDELYSNVTDKLRTLRMNTGIHFSIWPDLRASLMYQYQNNQGGRQTKYGAESYYTRNQINRLSQINSLSGEVYRPVPLGAIWDNRSRTYNSHYGRTQLDYQKDVLDFLNISALAGFEIRSDDMGNSAYRLYGYDPETGTNKNALVDYTDRFPVFYNRSSTARIEPYTSNNFTSDRYVSYYLNSVFSVKNRYIFSASVRKDNSNLFGVKPNRRGVPLWSTGFAWLINEENVLPEDVFSYLKFRMSYGYSGNVSKSISSYLTVRALSLVNPFGETYNEITNPPNPSLRWERVQTYNAGLDLGLFDNRISASIEVYRKNGIDLIGNSPIAPQTGVEVFIGNTASTQSDGLDLTLTTRNMNGKLTWTTDYLLSVNRDRVTKYEANVGNNFLVIRQAYDTPIVGNPYFSLYSFPWAGLNSSGDPQIWFEGAQSTDYAAAKNTNERDNLVFNGSTVPTSFGSLRNTVTYKGLELSFNVTYRLGYYFRRNSFNNSSVYNAVGFQRAVDYGNRWKTPGDEEITDVPAAIYPSNFNRNDIYTYSSVLVENAGNIRLQDIRLAWDIAKSNPSAFRFFTSGEIFVYVHNPGYIWRANRRGLDPDNPLPSITSFSQPRTCAIGIRATL